MAKRPKLILHAGTHKTGTTAIQAFCQENREKLDALGILYPKLPVGGKRASEQHHDLAHAFSRRPQRLTPEASRALLARWAEEAERSGKTVLISAEPLWRHLLDRPEPDADWLARRRAYLGAFASAVAPFDTQVLLVFRNPVDFAQSLYIERVSAKLRGAGPDFQTVVREVSETNLRYGDNALLFREFFGQVQCMVYEDLCRTDLIHAFFDAAGIDVSGLEAKGSVVRKSASPAEAYVTNFIKGLVPKSATKKDISTMLREPSLRAIIDAYAAENKGAQLWQSGAARMELLREMQPQLRVLSDEFGVDVSRWQEDMAARPEPKVVADLDPERKAEIEEIVADWWRRRDTIPGRIWRRFSS